MKLQYLLSATLILLPLASRAGQPAPPVVPEPVASVKPALPPEPPPFGLVTFDLDFPGGSPRELVRAIQKATDRTLNVIIPEEYADVHLPALKMKHVDAPHLFAALSMVSRKEAVYPSQWDGAGNPVSFSSATTSYGFRNAGDGKVNDDTIWTFYVTEPRIPAAPKPNQPSTRRCQFFALARYLQEGFTVDDITTAIQTASKMLGEGGGPEISFHKDTKLLIAVGEPSKLVIISEVLAALDRSQAESHLIDPATGLPIQQVLRGKKEGEKK